MKPFVVNDDGSIELAEGIKALPICGTLFSLKYNKEEGDAEGRQRYRISKEVSYLYYKHSWESSYSNMSEKDAEVRIRELLDIDKDWKMSDELKELEKYIVEAQETNNAWRSLKIARKLLLRLEEQAEDVEDMKVITTYLLDLPKLNATILELEKQFDASKRKVLAVGQKEIGSWEMVD